MRCLEITKTCRLQFSDDDPEFLKWESWASDEGLDLSTFLENESHLLEDECAQEGWDIDIYEMSARGERS